MLNPEHSTMVQWYSCGVVCGKDGKDGDGGRNEGDGGRGRDEEDGGDGQDWIHVSMERELCTD